jgi:hypothetical protein
VNIAYTGEGAANPMTIWGGGLSNFWDQCRQLSGRRKSGGTGEGTLLSDGLAGHSNGNKELQVGVFCIELSQCCRNKHINL